MDFDVLVVGTGAAGLSLALQLPKTMRCALISKGALSSGSTPWAQGGMAAVLHDRDSIDAHVRDTLAAGAGLCHEDAVRFTVANSRNVVEWLVGQGVDFDMRTDKPGQDFKEFHLTMEGGHTHRRIVHAADRTGRAISDVLSARASEASNITILTNHCAVELITEHHRCLGAYVLDTAKQEVNTITAGAVVLAAGGASKAYRYTTNPDGASGDGIALAWRAGCRVADLEFNQFHPTCLFHPAAKSFLVSEALRGEGAFLRLPNGERFMHRFDEREELAPRDIVARAIDHEMKRLGLECVYLDITHQPRAFLEQHFPTVLHRCQELGIDIATQQIPVVPAAHYTCGGVIVDQYGQTDIAGLYAIGETACTGLHGANRMASNSLLECFVYGQSAAQHIAQAERSVRRILPRWDESRVTSSDELVVIQHNWREVRQLMWDYMGIVRSDRRLHYLRQRLDILEVEIADYYSRFRVSRPMLELRNLTTVAGLMVNCALARKESRGLHFNKDYPHLLPEPKHSMLIPTNADPAMHSSSLSKALPRYA